MAEMTDLLEKIVDRLDTLTSAVTELHSDIRKELSYWEKGSFAKNIIDEIQYLRKELNYWAQGGSFARNLIDCLQSIEKAVNSLKR